MFWNRTWRHRLECNPKKNFEFDSLETNCLAEHWLLPSVPPVVPLSQISCFAYPHYPFSYLRVVKTHHLHAKTCMWVFKMSLDLLNLKLMLLNFLVNLIGIFKLCRFRLLCLSLLNDNCNRCARTCLHYFRYCLNFTCFIFLSFASHCTWLF